MENPTLFVGIDIAARTASIAAIRTVQDKPRQLDIEQTSSGFKRLHKFLRRYETTPETTCVVMEATSSYWFNIALYLVNLNYRVSVVNPASAYYFARSVLKRNKNDPMDAHTLAEMGTVMYERLPVWTAPPPIYENIRQRLMNREALVHMKTQTKNREHASQARGTVLETTQERNTALLILLNEQIAEIDTELEDLFSQDDDWAASARRLTTIPGIGTVTAAWILVATQNFETFDTAQQAASFAGLVPRQRQSGTSLNTRGRIGYAGHRRLRHALYLAAMSAARFNPPIERFYQRLKAKGKPGKVALIAAARKLMHQCWAVVKYQQDYDPEYNRKQNTPATQTDIPTEADVAVDTEVDIEAQIEPQNNDV